MVVLSAPNYTIRGESSSPFLCKGIESRTYLIICDRLVYLFIYFCFLKDKCAAEGGEKIGESFNSPIFNSPPPPAQLFQILRYAFGTQPEFLRVKWEITKQPHTILTRGQVRSIKAGEMGGT